MTHTAKHAPGKRSVGMAAERRKATTPPHAVDSRCDFSNDCRAAAGALKAALVELYAAVGADGSRPQDVSRRFSLDKNLTWKITKLLQSDDALEAAPFIPGTEGLDILFRAMRPIAPTDVLGRVEEAARGFADMVERHAGDRPTFELLLDSTTRARNFEVSRKLAFRGNSGVWGLQARVRVTAHFLAPNPAKRDRLDFALVAGLVGLRRLRPVADWPLFRFVSYNDDGSLRGDLGGRQPIEASAENSWLMPSFCSPPAPPLIASEHDNAVTYRLGDGPVGRTGEVTCFFGMYEPGVVSRYATPVDQFGEVSSVITLPIETLLFDLFVHRSLVEAHDPEVCVFGRPSGSVSPDPADRGGQRLPISETLQDITGAPPQVATELVPNYDQIIAATFARARWDPLDFVARRLVLAYPPMPSTVVLRHRLPEPPTSQ